MSVYNDKIASMLALSDIEGTISALDAVFKDDATFRRQMARFFEATTDAVFFLDREYRFVFLNRRAHELLVSGGDDILGTILFERYPDTVYEGSPFVAAYTGSMERNTIGDFEAYYPDPFDFWLRVQSYPVEGGIMVFFRDITQDRVLQETLRRKSEQAERQLAEIEALYRTAPIGLALIDAVSYTYLRLNDRQAAFFGMKPDEIVGRGVIEMAPIEGLKELFDQVAAGQPVINFPLQGSLATDEPGTLRYWTVSYFPVFGHDGTVTAITAASLEVTQQRNAEQALIQSEKLAVVGRLASSIAHEINNPLEAVTNLLYLAARTDDLPQVREYLQIADVELRRVAGITAQTLRFHKQASSPQAIIGSDLFASVLVIFQGRIANASVTVLERHRAFEPVRCFEGEIRQVLSNLVSNALDAMSAHGGNLSLRTRIATNWTAGERGLALTVADTGTGMAESVVAKLFNAFYTTKGITGTGLGLWVTREIVDRHRGTLRLRTTQTPGRNGTIFVVFLPFDAAER